MSEKSRDGRRSASPLRDSRGGRLHELWLSPGELWGLPFADAFTHLE
jgi:hypothetical protein